MKYICFIAIVFWGVYGGIYAQTLPISVFSPVSGNSVSLPYQEVNFLSARMQGMGYPLFNVIRDTVTDLFRNPVSLYGLKKPFLTGYYQREPRPVQTYPPPYLNEPFPEKNGNEDLPFYAAGYWTPRLKFLGKPAGIFLQYSGSKNKTRQESFYPRFNPETLDETYRTSDESRYHKILSQLWIGLLDRPKMKMGISYGLFTSKNSSDRDRAQTTIRNSYAGYKIFERETYQIEDLSRFYQHQLNIGMSFPLSRWRPEFRLGLFTIRQKFDYSYKNYREEYNYYPENPDSVFNTGIYDYLYKNNGTRNIDGIEFSGQMTPGFATLFFHVAGGSFTPDEQQSDYNRIIHTYQEDTTKNYLEDIKYNFNDNGTLWRLRAGMGKEFTPAPFLHLYSAFIGQYYYHSLSGALGTEGDYMDYSYSDSITTSKDYWNKLTYSQYRWLVLLPVALEIRHKIFSLRMGVTWYISARKEKTEFENGGNDLPYYNSSYSRSVERSSYMGLGIHRKGWDLNIAAESNLFDYEQWIVEFRYSF